MRPKIESEVVLFNYFFYNPKGVLDTPKLHKIKKSIFDNFKGSLYVDITDSSIVGAVESTRYAFRWDPTNTDNIVRAQESDQHYNKKLLKAFNSGLPQDVVSALEKACRINP